MKNSLWFVVLVLLTPSVLLSEEVVSKVYTPPIGLGVSAGLGVGGEQDWSMRYKDQKESGFNDLTTSKALSLFYFYPMGEHLEIGVNGRFMFWNTDAGEEDDMDSNMMVDLSPVVKLFHRFDSNLKGCVKLYLGVSYNIVGEKDLEDFVMENSLGYNYGLSTALEMRIVDNVSGIFEFGYVANNVSGYIKGKGEYKGIKVSYREELGQFLINTGLMF